MKIPTKALATVLSAGLGLSGSCGIPRHLDEDLTFRHLQTMGELPEYLFFAAEGYDSRLTAILTPKVELVQDYDDLEAAHVRALPETIQEMLEFGRIEFYVPLHSTNEDERSFPEFQEVRMDDDDEPMAVLTPEWAYNFVHANVLQEQGLLGQGLRVGVLDTGIDPNVSFAREQLRGFLDVVDHRSAPYDDVGHGTFVAGIISRVLPEAELFVYSVYNASEEAYCIRDILEGLDSVIADDIDVINLSWGFAVPEALEGMTWADGNRVLEEALERVAAEGTIIVAAAGNGRYENALDPQQLPNGSSVVISVGATTHYGEIAPFSDLDAHIFAPGKGVYSDFNATWAGYNNGTSFSAPLVTAAVAVIRQMLGSRGEQFTRDDVLDILLLTARPESSTIRFSDGEERAFPFLVLDYERLAEYLRGVR